jgi:hypothetical protein
MDQTRKRLIELPILLALVAILAISFSTTVPMAYAYNGDNYGHHQAQVSVDSVTLNGNTLIVRVSATIKDDSVKSVRFHLDVAYFPIVKGAVKGPVNGPNKYGANFYDTDLTVKVSGGQATATFTVRFLGYGEYAFTLNAYSVPNYQWLGFDWFDPIEGTAPD